MLESSMYAALERVLPSDTLFRVENLLNRGFPDVFYGCMGHVGVMELKRIDSNPRGAVVTIPWRPGQLAWHYDYAVKNHNEDHYFLCLTMLDRWYFIHHDIKEQYTKKELEEYFLCPNGVLKEYGYKIIQLLSHYS